MLGLYCIIHVFWFAGVFCFFLCIALCMLFFFFFQAEDGIRDYKVTGVQTCALPILSGCRWSKRAVVSSGFVATRLSCLFEGVGIANLSMKTIVPVISTTMRAIKARCTIVGSVGGFLEKTTSSDAVRGRETSRCIRGNRSRSWGASGPNSGPEKSVPNARDRKS